MSADPGDRFEPWVSFTQDPRRPANAHLRASDADRDLLQRVLASAYADGRLTRQEFDERSDALISARTLGELPPLVRDLVPERPPQTGAAAVADRALANYRRERTESIWRGLTAIAICWVVWGVTTAPGFPWPAIVTAAVGANVLRVVTTKDAYLADERRRLEKKARKRELPPPDDTPA
ncbi:MAG: DUF1707 SHOCT-like domain-containing protein [Nocardioides sp.]